MVVRQLEVTHGRHRHYGKRLVDLVKIGVRRLPVDFLE